MPLSGTSTNLFNTSSNGDSTTSLSSLFQFLTTLSMKKFFLISSLNISWCNLKEFSYVLSFFTLSEKTPSSLHLISGSCIKWCSLPWAFSFPHQTIPLPSAAPHMSCFLVLSPVSLLLSENIWATQYLVVKGPKLNTIFKQWAHQCHVHGFN